LVVRSVIFFRMSLCESPVVCMNWQLPSSACAVEKSDNCMSSKVAQPWQNKVACADQLAVREILTGISD